MPKLSLRDSHCYILRSYNGNFSELIIDVAENSAGGPESAFSQLTLTANIEISFCTSRRRLQSREKQIVEAQSEDQIVRQCSEFIGAERNSCAWKERATYQDINLGRLTRSE